MVSKKHRRAIALAVVMGAALPVVALASHGKAGLWEITYTMSMPDMPQVSPAQMAQMQAMGMRMPTQHSSTVQRCMTAAEVSSDNPPPPRSGSCTFANVKMTGHTFSGEETCTGDFEGHGQFSVTYDSDAHYTGTATMTGAAHGHPVHVSNSYEGKWISADCGSLK
jgi:hypothetical protein